MFFLMGCIKAPDVVIVDRYTALEVQASGNYAPLEDELQEQGLRVGPEGYTSDQLATPGSGTDDGNLGEAYRGVLSRADRMDSLRRRQCVGESMDGLLIQRDETCRGRIDEQDVANLLERENRNRRQVWHFMEEQNPDASMTHIQSAWRVEYLKTLPCESAIQKANNEWGRVECAE